MQWRITCYKISHHLRWACLVRRPLFVTKTHVRIDMGNDAISCRGIWISFPKWISLKMSGPTKENMPAHACSLLLLLPSFLFFPLAIICWACLIFSGHLWGISGPSKSQHSILACVSYWPKGFEDYRQEPSIEEGKTKATCLQDKVGEGGMSWAYALCSHTGTILFSIYVVQILHVTVT